MAQIYCKSIYNTNKSFELMKEVLMLVLLVLVAQNREYPLFYPFEQVPTATYKCIKEQGGYSKIILWVQSNQSGISDLSIQNLMNAKNAGLDVDISITPCRNRTAVNQCGLIMKKIGSFFTTIWIYPQAISGKCSWYVYPIQTSCQYIQQFIIEMKKYNKMIGIEGSEQSWRFSFGDNKACPQVGTFNLLWIPFGPQIDRQPNFNSYKQMGGWKAPYAKVYADKFICGETLSMVYSA